MRLGSASCFSLMSRAVGFATCGIEAYGETGTIGRRREQDVRVDGGVLGVEHTGMLVMRVYRQNQ